MVDNSDLAKLNRYMGGTGDAAAFMDASIGDGFPPTTAKLGESRAGSLALLISSLREEYNLTFDQAVQMWLLSTYSPDAIRFPPPTGT